VDHGLRVPVQILAARTPLAPASPPIGCRGIFARDRSPRLSDLEPQFTCSACGKRGADVRPDFNWNRSTVPAMGYRNTAQCPILEHSPQPD
jgi:hypothetical protein